MTWWVYKAGSMYFVGTPLHGPPSTSLFPCCLVVITPVIHPGSRGSQRWCRAVGVVHRPFCSRFSRFFAKN